MSRGRERDRLADRQTDRQTEGKHFCSRTHFVMSVNNLIQQNNKVFASKISIIANLCKELQKQSGSAKKRKRKKMKK